MKSILVQVETDYKRYTPYDLSGCGAIGQLYGCIRCSYFSGDIRKQCATREKWVKDEKMTGGLFSYGKQDTD
jgi:hypothetical protein